MGVSKGVERRIEENKYVRWSMEGSGLFRYASNISIYPQFGISENEVTSYPHLLPFGTVFDSR